MKKEKGWFGWWEKKKKDVLVFRRCFLAQDVPPRLLHSL